MPSRVAPATPSLLPHAALAQDEAVLAVSPSGGWNEVKYSIVKVTHTPRRVQLRVGARSLSFDKAGELGQGNPLRYTYTLVRVG